MTRCGPKPPPMLPVDERNAIVTDHARLLYTIARDFSMVKAHPEILAAHAAVKTGIGELHLPDSQN